LTLYLPSVPAIASSAAMTTQPMSPSWVWHDPLGGLQNVARCATFRLVGPEQSLGDRMVPAAQNSPRPATAAISAVENFHRARPSTRREPFCGSSPSLSCNEGRKLQNNLYEYVDKFQL
jgi:hypothetical protein